MNYLIGNVRKLGKLESNPYILFDRLKGCKPSLVVSRDGNTKVLPISKKVAEELIAMGLGYGD